MINCPKCLMPFIFGEEIEKDGRYNKYYLLPCKCKISKSQFYKLKIINGENLPR